MAGVVNGVIMSKTPHTQTKPFQADRLPDKTDGRLSSDNLSGPDARYAGEDSEEDLRCGWCGWKPQWAQTFNNPRWLLFFLCLPAVAQGMICSGLVSISISSIEKRFDLNSKQSGLIVAAYDIAVILVLIPVCYLGAQRNKARWVGTGIILMGLGALLFALPHFLVDAYRYDPSAKNGTIICSSDNNTSPEDCQQSYLSDYMFMFILGQLFLGVGAAPMYTLGITYIDENVSQKVCSLYVGIYYAISAVGPAIGYVGGGLFLDVYGELGRVDLDTVRIGPSDPRWYGAWWIGFVFGGALALLGSLPMLGYAKRLPGAKERKLEDINESHQNAGDSVASRPGFGTNIMDLPKSLKILFMNPAYMFYTLANAVDSFLVSGFIAFIPKFLEQQFSLTSSLAGILGGGVIVTAAIIGTFLGGYLIKRLRLTCSGIFKLSLSSFMIGLALCLILLIRCPNLAFAGVTSSFNSTEIFVAEQPNFDHECNTGCHCSFTEYKPLCGENNVMYYSPCHAGCKDGYDASFSDCQCVAGTFTNGTTSSRTRGKAKEGKCNSDCQLLVPFLLLFVLLTIVTLMNAAPATAVVLRCVQPSQRSVGIGLQSLLIRAVGSVPGPIAFGAVIDSTCLLWQQKCGTNTSCLVYDNPVMSERFMIMSLCLKVLACIFCFLALKTYKPPLHESASEAAITQPSSSSTSAETRDVGHDNPAMTVYESHM